MAGQRGERGAPNRRPVLVCVECGTRSGLRTPGWRGYRTDDPTDEDDAPALAFYCPTCAANEFGDSRQ